MAPFRPTGRGTGIVLYSAGVFFFAVNDAIGKWLVTDYGAGEVMALRTLGAALVLAALQWRHPVDLRPRGQYGLHALRILCSAADTFAFYAATGHMPLADVMTFYMASPIIIVTLSAVLLGEKLGPARIAAVAVGFVGVVIALHPTGASFTPAALLALAGSIMFGTTLVITRKLRDLHWLPLVGYQFLGSGLIGAVASAATWVMPGARDLGLFALIGIVAVACFLMITRALSLTAASVLAPLQYASIVWATLIGWLVWRDVPTAGTLAGVAIIMASGLIVLRAERSAPEPSGTPQPSSTPM